MSTPNSDTVAYTPNTDNMMSTPSSDTMAYTPNSDSMVNTPISDNMASTTDPDNKLSTPEVSDNESASSFGNNSCSTGTLKKAYNNVSEPLQKKIQLENKLEVGSVLESLDQVYVLYCEYDRSVGFSAKKGTQSYFRGVKGTAHTTEDDSFINMMLYLSLCEGSSDKKCFIDEIPKFKRQVLRTNCKARLCVIRERGRP